MRMSVPEDVRSSMLIQLSVAGDALAFPRETEDDAAAPVAAGSPLFTTGRNPSGTSCLAYFRFHQKYWLSVIPFVRQKSNSVF